MGHERGIVRWVNSDLRGFEVIGTTALTAAGFGLFAFWLSHGSGIWGKGELGNLFSKFAQWKK